MTATRLPGLQRGAPVEIEVDGRKITAYEGETVATALLAAGYRTFWQGQPDQEPGRLYCGMGVCMQCLVTIDGVHNRRACHTAVQPGLKVETRP